MKTTIKIQNLKCSGCENTIKHNLEEIKSIKNIQINQEEGAVTFDYENDLILEKVKSRLKKLVIQKLEKKINWAPKQNPM